MSGATGFESRPLPPALAPLAGERRWIRWGWTQLASGEWDKPPLGDRGEWVSTSKPENLMTLAEAVARLRDGVHSGVGFVPDERLPWLFLDLDDCRNPVDGRLTADAEVVLAACQGAYAEVTPSGGGIRIVGRDEGWDGAGKARFRWGPKGDRGCLHGEAYRAKNYVTVTFLPLPGRAGTAGVEVAAIGAVAQALVDDAANTVGAGKGLEDRGPRERADLEAPIEVVRELLAGIPNEGGADWSWWVEGVGLAVWNATGGSTEGLEAWDAWSRRNAAYGLGETCEQAWHRITNSAPDRIGWGTLDRLWKQARKAEGRDWAWTERPALGAWRGSTGGAERLSVEAQAAPVATTVETMLPGAWSGGTVTHRPPENVPMLYAGTPLNSADAFMAVKFTHPEGPTLRHKNGDYIVWAATHWREADPEGVRSACYEFLEKARTPGGEKDANGRFTGTVPFNPTSKKVTDVMDALKARTHLDRGMEAPTWLDGGRGAETIVACSNGLLDVTTGVLTPPTPRFLNTSAIIYPYDPGANRPVLWLKFLSQLWPNDAEAIATLQEMFGLLLTDITRFQKAFLVIGPRRSGKGTIRGVLDALIGKDNIESPVLSDFAERFGLTALIGKRLIVISDARLDGRTDQQAIVERLLTITGEDGMTLDRKYRAPWTGRLTGRILITTNEMPRLEDASGALADRFIVLVLKRSFAGEEDLALLGNLLTEIPGILNWALEGLRRLLDRGRFVIPKSSVEVGTEMRDLSSPIGEFLREECDVGKECQEARDGLYLRWCAWCRQEGRSHPGNGATFGRMLRAALPELTTERPRAADGTESRRRTYVGVGPKAATAAATETPLPPNVVPFAARQFGVRTGAD